MSKSMIPFLSLLLTVATLFACNSKCDKCEDSEKNMLPVETDDPPVVPVVVDEPPIDTGVHPLAIQCMNDWHAALRRSVVGMVEVYDIKSVTTGSVDPNKKNGTVKRRVTSQIIEVKKLSRTISETVKYFEPNRRTYYDTYEETEDDKSLTCDIIDQGEDDKLTMTILEERYESLTVKAGTFDTRYQKILINRDYGTYSFEELSDVWTIDDGTFVIKERIVKADKNENAPDTVVTTYRELREYIRPAQSEPGTSSAIRQPQKSHASEVSQVVGSCMTGRAEYAEHRCIDFLDLQGDDFTAIKAWCEARRLPERAVWTESACFGTVNNPLVGVMTGIPRKGDWDNLQVGDYKISKVSYIDWSYQQ